MSEYAAGAHDRNERVSSLLDNQPRSVDAAIDDFAVEAQSFTTSTTNVAAFSAAALAFQFTNTRIANIVFSSFTPVFALGTVTNVSRYKNRNEEWRVTFRDKRFVHVLKAVFSLMSRQEREATQKEDNPFVRILEVQKDAFVRNVEYFDEPPPAAFLAAYDALIAGRHDPSAIERFVRDVCEKMLPDTYQAAA